MPERSAAVSEAVRRPGRVGWLLGLALSWTVPRVSPHPCHPPTGARFLAWRPGSRAGTQVPLTPDDWRGRSGVGGCPHLTVLRRYRQRVDGSSGRFRWRTWLRRHLPRRLVALGIAGKGKTDCGQHEWYNADGSVQHCYHCVIGERPYDSGGHE
jgi:hypothetical protein